MIRASLLLALPLFWIIQAGTQAMAGPSVDLSGHLWMTWNATLGDPFSTTGLTWPERVDLVPFVGGWLDLWLGGLLTPWVGVTVAWNLVMGLYLVVAGLGGAALGRALGASRDFALLSGLLLQLDGFTLHHLAAGRSEQVGLGYVALALAGAIHAWRQPGWRPVIGTAGAVLLVALASWQLLLFLALSLCILQVGLWVEKRPAGAWVRWVCLVGLAALVVLPWVAFFVDHAAASGRFEDLAGNPIRALPQASVGWLGWLTPGEVRPGWLALSCIALLPWTAPKRDRRLWVVLVLGLVLATLLAAGPNPGLWQPRPSSGPGLATWVHDLPGLRWFAWPGRYLAAWSLLAGPAAALTAQALWKRPGPAFSLGLALTLVAWAGLEAKRNGVWPGPGFALPTGADLTAIRDDPTEGAVLDLLQPPNPVDQLRFQDRQLVHGRPILFSMPLHHHIVEDVHDRAREDPTLSWFLDLRRRPPYPPAPDSQDWQKLANQGFSFVTLHRQGVRRQLIQVAEEGIRQALGPPWIEGPGGAVTWRLPRTESDAEVPG